MPKYKESNKADRGGPHGTLLSRRAPFSSASSSASTSSAGGSGEVMSMHHPRRSLGGRGREWASESHKLLEAMLELDDSKPFREPIDPLKYPEYYSMTDKPLDLSQILLSLHRGVYGSLEAFAADMRLMFDNYKTFFSDANSETYAMIHRLSFWFESELVRIKNPRMTMKQQLIHLSTRSPNDQPSSNRMYHMKARPRPGSLEARILALQEDNIRTLANSPMSNSPTETPPHSQVDETDLPHKQKGQQPNTNIILSIGSGSCTILQGQDTSPSRSHDRSFSAPVDSSAAGDKGTSRSLPVLGTLRSVMANSEPVASERPDAASRSGLIGQPQVAFQAVPLSQAELDLRVDVTNIWFGLTRCKPQQPVRITEKGITMHLKMNEKSETVPVLLGADELVRCAAHFGRSRRHTIFLFVLPSFIKKLATISDRFNHMQGGLIAMFISALSSSQMSRLVHLFWSMGRKSMFGQIFTEVDQKAALSLLANIKPTIMEKLPEKYRDSVASQNEQRFVSPSLSSSAATAVGSSTVQSTSATPSVNTKSRHGAFTASSTDSSEQMYADENDATSEDRSFSSKMNSLRMFLRKHKEGEWSATRLSPAQPGDSEPSEIPQQQDECMEPALSMGDLRDIFMAITGQQPKDIPDLNSAKTKSLSSSKDRDTVDSTAYNLDDAVSPNETDPRPKDTAALCAPDSVTPAVRNSEEELPGDPDLPMDLSSERKRGTQDPEQSILEISVDDEESDLEIIIPSDESDNEGPIRKKSRTASQPDTDDLVMTAEKISIKCPITQQTMKNPVKNRHCGHCYDREGVQELIRHRADKARCPVPGCSNPTPLNMMNMRYEYELWKHIQTKTKAEPSTN